MFDCLRDYYCYRPEVIVDFIFDKGLLSIQIKNIGRRPAHNVHIDFDKQFYGLSGSKLFPELAMFKNISFLAPGKELTTFLDSSSAYFERDEPAQHTISVAYKDHRGKDYNDTIKHNLDIYRDIVYTESNG